MKENVVLVKNEEDFKRRANIENLKSSLGGYGNDIIREYIVADLTAEQAYELWKQDKITSAEYQYVLEK